MIEIANPEIRLTTKMSKTDDSRKKTILEKIKVEAWLFIDLLLLNDYSINIIEYEYQLTPKPLPSMIAIFNFFFKSFFDV